MKATLSSVFVRVLVLLAFLGQGSYATLRGAESAPNIVIFLVDDMGIMDSSVPFLTDENGVPKRFPLNDYYRTPNMERLAARGTRFSQFYAMSVCSPTRLCIATGQNAARHRTTNWINPDNNNAGPQGAPDWNWKGLSKQSVTLAKVLQKNGYRTIHVGKGHFGPRGSEGEDPLNIGFDINVGGSSIGQPGSYLGMQNYGNAVGSKKATNHPVPGLEKYHGTETFLSDALTAEASRHITDAVKDGKPFYLNFAHYAVHAPFNVDPRFMPHYADSGKPNPAQAFAALIEGMDKSLGELLDKLDELGVADNTLVFFLGDNGSDAPLGHEHSVACAAPLRGKKGAHYEGGMRVPFIAAWAKPNATREIQRQWAIPTGGVQTQMAAVFDLFPTVLSLAGAKSPGEHVVDGRNLQTLLSAKSDSNRPATFLMHYPHGPHRSSYFTVYRDGDWKVIYHYFPSEASENSHYQLYNLKRDPFEQQNLATSEPQVLQKMTNGLVTALDQHQAVYPVDKESRQPVKPVIPK